MSNVKSVYSGSGFQLALSIPSGDDDVVDGRRRVLVEKYGVVRR